MIHSGAKSAMDFKGPLGKKRPTGDDLHLFYYAKKTPTFEDRSNDSDSNNSNSGSINNNTTASNTMARSCDIRTSLLHDFEVPFGPWTKRSRIMSSFYPNNDNEDEMENRQIYRRAAGGKAFESLNIYFCHPPFAPETDLGPPPPITPPVTPLDQRLQHLPVASFAPPSSPSLSAAPSTNANARLPPTALRATPSNYRRPSQSSSLRSLSLTNTSSQYSSHPVMLGDSSGVDLGPGPAPPPSLTLPPLRELDKTIRPDPHLSPSQGSGIGGAAQLQRSPGSDPHLHQHLSSQSAPRLGQSSHLYQQKQQQQQQHYFTPNHSHAIPLSPHGSGPQQYSPQDQHSRHTSSIGSLPDLYMSSSSAPSTTTTSSLSRADSLSTMEYLQGSHPHPLHPQSHPPSSNPAGRSHGHGYTQALPTRHLSSAGGGSSTTTGSTTGSSYGYSVGSSSSTTSSNGRGLHYGHHQRYNHHHSTGLGRANLNAAVHQHQLQRHPHPDATVPPSSNGIEGPRAAGGETASSSRSGKLGSRDGSAGLEPPQQQQGRNSTKRAAQNRAAQRAFRQRKDLYVRELERKAEMLQQAEGKILQLTVRNRFLEDEIGRKQQSQHHPHQQKQQSAPHIAGANANGSPETLGPVGHFASSAGANAADSGPGPSNEAIEREMEDRDRDPLDRDQEWSREERATRPALLRHQSSQQLHLAYKTSLSSQTNASLKYQAMSAQSSSTHFRQQHIPESDYEHEEGTGNDIRHPLHRYPSESSINLSQESPGQVQGRRGSNSADSELSLSPSSHHQQYPGSTSSSSQERLPLHPISTSQRAAGPGSLSTSGYSSNPSSARSWTYMADDATLKPRSPMPASATTASGSSSSPVVVPGGMVSAISPPGRSYAEQSPYQGQGAVAARGADLEYMSDDHRSDHGSNNRGSIHDSIKKRPSDGSLSLGGSGAVASPRGGFADTYGHTSNQGEVRKQASWGSFLVAKGRGQSPVNLPPVSSLTTTGAADRRDMSGDMDMQDSFHQLHQYQQPRHLHHRASTGSVSVRDTDRLPSEGGGGGQSRMTMATDSPDIGSSFEVRFGSGGSKSGTTTPQMLRHQQQYFSSLEQQHQRLQQQQQQQQPQQQRGLPHTPEHEYPPSGVSSPHRAQPPYPSQYRPGQGLGSNEPSPRRDLGEKFHGQAHQDMPNSDMDGVFEHPRNCSNGNNSGIAGYNSEESMRSP